MIEQVKSSQSLNTELYIFQDKIQREKRGPKTELLFHLGFFSYLEKVGNQWSLHMVTLPPRVKWI